MNKSVPSNYVFEDMESFKKFKHRQKIQDFVSNLEKGDLGLSVLIEYGFILYGQTRTGKTATGHILSGNPLRGTKVSGQEMVEATTSRNRKAKIGNEMSSQTLIPNFFNVKMKNPIYPKDNTFVIDTPGYGDTYGVLRILANGYYHYRLYSKVQNMKFILCFDHIHLRNTGHTFIDTIMQFTSSFKDYIGNRHQIWKSCVFLFTKVQESGDALQDLKAKLQSLIKSLKTQFSQETEIALKQFINYIIQEDRIFYIKKIKKGQSAQGKDLLQKIEAKVQKWWSRDVVPQRNEVDMSNVLFSLSKQIILSTTQSDQNQQQFTELIKYYNLRIRQFCEYVSQKTDRSSLPYVLNQLVKDAMSDPDSHKFLDVMQSYVQKYYYKYDNLYKEERQKREESLFHLDHQSLQTNNTSRFNGGRSKKFMNDRNYIVKKFQALKEIEKLKDEINDRQFEDRSLEWLQECENNLYKIVKALNKVSYKRSKSIEAIYKYGYLIHRIVQEAKVFLLLIEISSSRQNQKRIKQAANNEFIDLFRSLKDFMGVGYIYMKESLSALDLQREFIKKFDINDPVNQKLVLNEALINFFTEIDISDDSEGTESGKIIKLVLKYSDQVLNQDKQNKVDLSLNDKNKLITRLTLSRINAQTAYAIKNDEESKNSNLFLVRNISKNLGILLQKSGKYELARQVFDTIKFVESVSRIYQLQIEGLGKVKESESGKRSFDLRMKYAGYLTQQCRQADAMRVLQEAYQLATNMQEMTQIKHQIGELRYKMKDPNRVTNYEKSLFSEQYFTEFPTCLEQEILEISNNPLDSKGY